MEKLSSIRLLVFLDNDKRLILEALQNELTFDQLNMYSNNTGYKTRLDENLKQLKKSDLVKEKISFENDGTKINRVRKFIRSI